MPLPEYAWASSLTLDPQTLTHFWSNTVPALARRIDSTNKLLVLGTAPYFDKVSNTLRNRALIFSHGRVLTQDKLFLTPWEGSFTRGDALNLITFKSARIAVLICLDIEVPELSVMLRNHGIDLILVPSATETILGTERVTRCASARAVELGCAVVVSPLVGRCKSDLVDENLGKLACYLPSQSAFTTDQRQLETEVIHTGLVTRRFRIDLEKLNSTRKATTETNPSLLKSVLVEPLLFQSH